MQQLFSVAMATYRFKRFHKPETSDAGWMREYLQDLFRCFLQDLMAIKVSSMYRQRNRQTDRQTDS